MKVLLSLGSNRGDRLGYLRAAVVALANTPSLSVEALSGLYETEPIGVTDQDAYLNGAVLIDTELSPHELLAAMKRIERETGRTPGPRWGPREIDIDIILHGDLVIDEESIQVPHPAFRDRRFVLAPLQEIAADTIDPVTGRTVSQLAAEACVQGAVERIAITL